MKNIKPLLLAGLMAPGLVLADASQYDYVEGGYINGSIDGINVDGIGLKGSIEFADRFLAVASFTDLGLDEVIVGTDIDADIRTLGLGYIFGRNEVASLYGTASYIKADVRFRLGGVHVGDDEQGARFEVGARMNIGRQAEAVLSATHTDLGGGDDDTVPTVGLVYQFLPSLSGVAFYNWDSDDEQLSLGLRWNF